MLARMSTITQRARRVLARLARGASGAAHGPPALLHLKAPPPALPTVPLCGETRGNGAEPFDAPAPRGAAIVRFAARLTSHLKASPPAWRRRCRFAVKRAKTLRSHLTLPTPFRTERLDRHRGGPRTRPPVPHSSPPAALPRSAPSPPAPTAPPSAHRSAGRKRRLRKRTFKPPTLPLFHSADRRVRGKE